MKITAITLGSYGDIMPFILLGEELVKRGYEYRLATFENYRDIVEKRGLVFSKISGDSEEMVSLLLGNSNNTRSEGMNGISFLLGKYPDLYDDFYRACEKNDLIIYMQFGALAYHFAEKFHIPVIRTFAFPFDVTRKYCSLMDTMKRDSLSCYFGNIMCRTLMAWAAVKTVNIWRERLGLKKMGRFGDYRKMNGENIITLYQYDQVLANKDKKWGDHIYLTGNWIRLAKNQENEEIKKLYQFIDQCEGTVYVGFGSMNYDKADGLYRRIIRILLKENKGVIVPKSCRDLINREFKKQSQRIYIMDYIPFEQFIHKVDAAIHHGGNGTVHACMRNGKPQLIMAFGADQVFWGGQCFYLRVGPAPINVKKGINETEFENSIIDLISDDNYRINSEKFSAEVSDNGIDIAADIIQKKIPLNQK
ncbi:MAG: glycosyltransferase family 1 protein [Ruminococcus sp.]|jgi:UDP:flavonoid glycosyltransferase YjiC (YdhE family)|nr:glycosyltransferase family 1 protein [Ruminococcus sp.]